MKASHKTRSRKHRRTTRAILKNGKSARRLHRRKTGRSGSVATKQRLEKANAG